MKVILVAPQVVPYWDAAQTTTRPVHLGELWFPSDASGLFVADFAGIVTFGVGSRAMPIERA
jgi:hypothetical protein